MTSRGRGHLPMVVIGNMKGTENGRGREIGKGVLKEMIGTERVTATVLMTEIVPKTEIVKEIATGTLNATVEIEIGLPEDMGTTQLETVVEMGAEVLV